MTTRELAQLAGVSQSTVSRCLSGQPGISLETVERIRNLAKKHGYVIKGDKKRSIVIQQKRAIAILSTENGNDDMYLNSLFNHLFNFISQENYLSFFETEQKSRPTLMRVKDMVATGMMDGFLIVQRVYDPGIDEYLTRIGIPHVYIHYFSINSREQVNIIDGDHYLGAYAATRHLLDLGHTRVLSVTAPGHEFSDRSGGFLAALRDADIAADPRRDILMSDHTYDCGYRTMREQINHAKGYTALFAQSDEMAIGCMNSLQDQGVRIPEDMSVVGFDGIEAGRYCRPALSTVRLRSEEVARASVERIIKLINGADDLQNVRTFIQPALVQRKSTAKHTEA